MYNDNSSGLGNVTYRADGLKDGSSSASLFVSGAVEAQLGDPSKKTIISGNMEGRDSVTFSMILNLYPWIQSICYLDFGYVDIRFYD